jgi:puromycin-sensitive aminopeptidase
MSDGPDPRPSKTYTRREFLGTVGWSTKPLLALTALGLLFRSTGRPFLADERPDQRGVDMSKPPSHEQPDPYRLPRHILPTRYDLRLEPDLERARFSGSVVITLSLLEPTSHLVCNAAELEVLSGQVTNTTGARHVGTIELDAALDRCHVCFPEIIEPGEWRLHLAFNGTLNDKLRGFYRSTFKDERGASHLVAATQFEATDARRAFPCWDEPDFKAVFSTTLVIDPSLTAVSNTEILSESVEQGKKVVRFADTIKMSTYLVAFVVGSLEATEPTFVGRTAIRLWAVPGKKHLAGFGQDIATASLQFFEDYYGIPYPGDKLDLLAVPDFASGAMENLGAITFRETALLVDQGTASHGELERIADVVAHENAHMWFGDLVTMAWWNGLWLNEAFATFMEMLAVDAWKPEWDRWTTFGVSRAAALSVDGLQSSRPIEYPVRAPKDAEAMFDVLTYEKGASVLRMLEQHIGPTVFRDGVRDYLHSHAYRNADTKDLWVSVGKVAAQPIPEMMDGWIFHPGYPLLAVSQSGPTELFITQQRFTYLPDGSSGRHRWHIPIQLRVYAGGATKTQRLLLADAERRVTIPEDCEAILVNEGGHGFYRVQYSQDLRAKLFRQGLDRLTAIERFNLINDVWATAVAGLTSLQEYLEFTASFTGERDKNVWAVLLDSFSLLNRIIESQDRPTLEAFVRARVGPAVAELGWTSRSRDSEPTKQLRGELIGALGKLGNDHRTQAKAAELYKVYRQDATLVDPNVLPAIVSVLAHTGGAVRYEEFSERFRAAKTPQEERRYLFALAGFQPKDLLGQTLARTLNGAIRTQDAPFVISAMMTSVYGRELAWTFVKTNWETMDRIFPKQGLRRMSGGIVGLATQELERDVQEFFASRKIDLGGKTLDQYLEQLRLTVAMRERDGAELRRYLAQFTS